jgi:hypothetical protein
MKLAAGRSAPAICNIINARRLARESDRQTHHSPIKFANQPPMIVMMVPPPREAVLMATDMLGASSCLHAISISLVIRTDVTS